MRQRRTLKMYKLALWLCLLCLAEASPGEFYYDIFGAPPSPIKNEMQTESSKSQCITESGEKGFCTASYLCLGDVRFSNGCSLTNESCCLKYASTSPSQDNASSQEECGWRNRAGVVTTIVGDQHEAKLGEFPWMVTITRMETVSEEGLAVNVHIGSGSLIHLKAVLTAAHVVKGREKLRVRAGEWNFRTNEEKAPHQVRDVASCVVHEEYNKSSSMSNDIALLFLTQPMFKTPNVGLACLPPLDQRMPEGAQCIVSGWGNFRKGDNQGILKKFKVSVVDGRSCQKKLRKSSLGVFFELHSSFFCAEAEAGVTILAGSGVSPLVCPIECQRNRYMQTGITSLAFGDGVPSVYTDVAAHRKWIDKQINTKGLNPQVYTF